MQRMIMFIAAACFASIWQPAFAAPEKKPVSTPATKPPAAKKKPRPRPSGPIAVPQGPAAPPGVPIPYPN